MLSESITPWSQLFQALIDDKTREFVGREYVFQAIADFLDSHNCGYFIIEAEPGVGKTAILAEYVRRTGCVVHFNIQVQGINRANQFLESVCQQLIARYALPYLFLPADATCDGSFLAQLLEKVSTQLKEDEQLVIAIDALDEVNLADQNTGVNILYLPPQLPDGIYFVLTQRWGVKVPLTTAVPTQIFNLLDEQNQSDNERDVRNYIQFRIDGSKYLQQWINEIGESIPNFISKITEKSENNFFYLLRILADIERGLYKDLDLESLPQSLQEYYEIHWRRIMETTQKLPSSRIKVIRFLCQIPEPVSCSFLAYLVDEDKFTVQTILTEWAQFLHQQTYDGQIRYSIYHESLRDFVSSKEKFSTIHAEIAERLLEKLFGNDYLKTPGTD